VTDSDSLSRDKLLEKARMLVASLEQGETEKAQTIVDEITHIRENDLFVEVGKLTRQLHESINNFQLEDRIMDITAQDIPDAKDRLEYVISMTEKAANTTMDAVEASLPMADSIGNSCQELSIDWTKLKEKKLKPGEFRALVGRMEKFLDATKGDTEQLQSLLTQVLMAQDFQDLTGQVIRRVIDLVHEVETSLVSMIRMFGCMNEYEQAQTKSKDKLDVDGIVAEGPVINPDERTDVVQNQDDVDDLLSSLGF
jgi:chemotaxis protein CheZ